MAKTQMPKRSSGVHLRSGSNVYQWKIKVPLDLRHLYPGQQWAHRGSLGTTDLREANLKAARLNAEWQERFAKDRQKLSHSEPTPEPKAVDAISPELAKLIAETLRHDVLAVDEDIRTNPKKHGLGGGLSVALAGMPDYLSEDVAATNLEQEAKISKALAKSQRSVAMPALERTAEKLGLVITPQTPGLAEALLVCLRALKEAYSAAVARDRGESVLTPPLPAPAPPKPVKPRKLRDVFNEWKKLKGHTVALDTIKARERALRLYEEATGDPALQGITRAMGHELARYLTNLGGASKTASERMNYVCALLKFACQELEWTERNPWEGIKMEYTTETERKPWTPDQIGAFFALPLFTSYALPQRAKRAGADAAYWIPLLGLFTGARVGELVQLQVSDIMQTEDVWCIDINEDNGKRLKTQSSKRQVPIHSELIRLGFLDYVRDIKDAGHASLWPTMHLNKEKPSHGFSLWFNETPRHAVKDADGNKVDIPEFHCLRHLVRSTMAEANVPEADQDDITGHATRGSTGTRVYRHATMKKLQAAIESLHYPTLTLERSYSREKLGVTKHD